jgi:1-acyl-sn-glycerol-3-phosphate acyltransferase
VLVDKLFYGWRLIGTGLGFVALGFGGMVLALTIIPLASLLTRDPETRTRRAQTIIRASLQLYVLVLRALGVIRVDVTGAETLAACRGLLIVANHPTLLDVVLIMAQVPRACCVVKHQLWDNPFLRPVVTATGYIRNDLPPEVFLEKCRDALAAGNNLIIFPEGTRSVPGQALHFQRGFAHIATLLAADLQPITITCEPITLVKGAPWYRIPPRPGHWRLEAANRIEIRPFLDCAARPLAARRLVSHLESYYNGKLKHG